MECQENGHLNYEFTLFEYLRKTFVSLVTLPALSPIADEGQSKHMIASWKSKAALVTWKASEPPVRVGKVVVNNLSDLKLKISLCAAAGCLWKNSQEHFTVEAKSVSVLDLPDWKYLTIADLASGRQLKRTLWSGQFYRSNPANILSVLQESATVTQVWFSDKSGTDVLLGVLQ
ncbi:hypothetical protein R1sor_009630 [Riccia sorocarpa]|uniref:Uncharacterized protein n=1 Tax=Riccia sorocarpa TaxID=122646 RepID=A0ABD3I1S1_9MARC